MFAVIYRAYLNPGHEEEFQEAWNTVAAYFVQKRGALGSLLHRTEEGLWVAYSRWPSKALRDASWPGENAPSGELPGKIRAAVIAIQKCIDQERKIPEICMELVTEVLCSLNTGEVL